MATKDCPECGAEVPTSAQRCKECFHDFTEVKKTSYTGPLLVLGTLAAMALMGALTFFIILQQPLDRRIQVDQETQSVVYITQYRSGPVTERLMWSDIARLEHVVHQNGKNEIYAYDLKGEQWTLHEATPEPLSSTARHYESLIGKPLVVTDNTTGFHKTAKPDEAATPQ